MTKSYDYIVVGDGIASQLILFSLIRIKKIDPSLIAQIFSTELAPACSLNTTSVVCLNGARKGISPLGDLLVDSFNEFESFYNKYSPKGVSKGVQFSICDQSEQGKLDYERRFDSIDNFKKSKKFSGTKLPIEFKNDLFGKIWNSYLIEPIDFLSWFKELNGVERVNDFISEVDEDGALIGRSGVSYTSKNIIMCTGAYTTKLFNNLEIEDNTIERSKIVPGTYLTFSNIDFGQKSFVISRKHSNLVYRGESKTLLIGGTTTKMGHEGVDHLGIVKQYELFKEVLKNELSLELPPFKEASSKIGLRHKGVKRMPYCGLIESRKDTKIFGLFGLYKNGFTFSFKLAVELVDRILS